jgi:hypothetical protein
MSYIGNVPTNVAFLTDTFNGTGSTTAFTLSAAPANTNSILVAVSGVLQDPSTYSISGTALNFSAAPPAGTGNISVRFLGIPASGIVTTAYRTQTEFTATAGQTTFSVPSYTVGFIDVYRNGALLGSADFTATNGTTVVLTAGASAGDLVETISFSVSSVLNAIPATAGAVVDNYILSMAGSKLTGTQSIPKATLPTGSVLQVVSAIKTDTSSTSSTTFGDISGLSVSITPTSSSSKILVFLNVDGSNDAGGMAVRLVRDSTAIAIGTAASGNQTNTTLTNYYNNTDANSHRSSGITFLDSPATTSATTYKAQFRVGTSGNGYINRSTGTDNAAYNMYAVSTITVMEIAA